MTQKFCEWHAKRNQRRKNMSVKNAESNAELERTFGRYKINKRKKNSVTF